MTDSTASSSVQRSLMTAFNTAEQRQSPYKHWRLHELFPVDIARSISTLPFEPPVIDDTGGRRETHNDSRRFFDQDAINRFPTCRSIAEAFQSAELINTIQNRCGLSLAGTNLRIEYALDIRGFWLEPHTDLGVKKFTMLAYMAEDPEHVQWGTDIYFSKEQHAEQVPATFNTAMIFVPADNTWHGFEPRPINGIRRTLIINYVAPEWRNRHELAFPNTPIAPV
ncbi:2OG-Fe(II) oxygenase [Halothiobacillus sp.]|uniref:2OG-Fe(II) oxygenase n=1 Tax=Halothiobacillus sp. TaxID=1891311 RepID=UPI002AD22344|nr:2OG-Fe(II) oxygenase [Halothiobacillus sp.]